MHAAPSVILFTVLSGLGFGFLGFLALGLPAVHGWHAFFSWGIGYALAVGGLVASTFHLGNPQRALLAFTQWRSSWLSREGWASCLTLFLLAPLALSDWLGWALPRGFGVIGASMALVTVLCTAMIYGQLKSVPRWNHPLVPVQFVAFALTGGALMAGQRWLAIALCLALVVVMIAYFRIGDGLFAKKGATLGSATGLGRIGRPEVFEQPHTSPNYLMREMIHVVGRKHAAKLRVIAVLFTALLPALVMLVLFPFAKHAALMLAVAAHLLGAFAQRWLFFSEAEHVVGLYYGARG